MDHKFVASGILWNLPETIKWNDSQHKKKQKGPQTYHNMYMYCWLSFGLVLFSPSCYGSGYIL